MYAREMLIQSLPLLIFCGIGGIIAGSMLGVMIELFSKIPGLIVTIPAIIALRGNISTAFGSRLGSAYHLGIIDANNMWNVELKQNIIGSLVLSFLASIVVGILAYSTTVVFFHIIPDAIKIIAIVLLAGMLSALVLTFLTITITHFVFKRGYDPDNITGPALATFGDIVTITCMLGSAVLLEAIA